MKETGTACFVSFPWQFQTYRNSYYKTDATLWGLQQADTMNYSSALGSSDCSLWHKSYKQRVLLSSAAQKWQRSKW